MLSSDWLRSSFPSTEKELILWGPEALNQSLVLEMEEWTEGWRQYKLQKCTSWDRFFNASLQAGVLLVEEDLDHSPT